MALTVPNASSMPCRFALLDPDFVKVQAFRFSMIHADERRQTSTPDESSQ